MEGNGAPLQYPCLENPMDGGAWGAAVHGVTKSQTWLSDYTFTFHFHALEKDMATHSSILAWRIPGMGEPGGLPSMGSHRVGHNSRDLAAAATYSSSFSWTVCHSCLPDFRNTAHCHRRGVIVKGLMYFFKGFLYLIKFFSNEKGTLYLPTCMYRSINVFIMSD